MAVSNEFWLSPRTKVYAWYDVGTETGTGNQTLDAVDIRGCEKMGFIWNASENTNGAPVIEIEVLLDLDPAGGGDTGTTNNLNYCMYSQGAYQATLLIGALAGGGFAAVGMTGVENGGVDHAPWMFNFAQVDITANGTNGVYDMYLVVKLEAP